MATVAFQVIGSNWGPVGSAIGAAIGAYIDQQLFGPSGDVEGPKVADLKISSATYGAAIPLPYGPTNRMKGNIIWSTDLVETANEEESGKGGGGQTYTSYTYSLSCAVAVSGREISQIKRIWANGKIIYSKETADVTFPSAGGDGTLLVKAFYEAVMSGTHAVMGDIYFYPGNGTQEPNTFIESIEGLGNVPGYRHTAYVVFVDLQLADFGNRMPNFEFEVEADESITVGNTLKDLTVRANIPSNEVSVFGIDDQLGGYVVSRQAPVYKAAEPLLTTYNLDVADQVGQIRYIKKTSGMKGSIDLEVMNARESGSTPSQNFPISYSVETEVYMPDQVNITYLDEEMDYQLNTQRAYRKYGNAINIINLEIPVVMSSQVAIDMAHRLLWLAWAHKNGASFSANDSWRRVNAGDVLGVPVPGNRVVPMRITRKQRGRNGIIEFDAIYEDSELFNLQIAGIDGTPRHSVFDKSGATTWIPIDAPLLRDTDSPTGFYWAATGLDAWRGASIKRSSDGGTTFADMSDVVVRSPIGNVTGTLGDGPTEVIDTINTLTVTLISSKTTMESISEELLFNGNNAAWIGPAEGGIGEVIQFQTATLISGTTYELSNFVRGRLGTEHFTGSHASGEVLVMLKRGPLGTSDFGLPDWNKLNFYKAITFLQYEEVTDSQEFTNTGVRSKPLSPVHLKGTRDTSNNLTITWLRRSRLRQPGLGYGPLPLGETTEQYEIDILDGSTVVRTITATSETATYTAAEQTSDGLTPGDFVSMNIYQISETYNRGYPAAGLV